MLYLFIVVLIEDASRSCPERPMARLTVPKDLIVSFRQQLALFVFNGEFNGVRAIAKEMVVVDFSFTNSDNVFLRLEIPDSAIQ